MIWPATSRWARRLVELLIAIILAKFVIVSILTLATAAITNTGLTDAEDNTFEQMLAGAALLVLAPWSPFALLRMLPMMELAASSIVHQRTAVQTAAGTAAVHNPAVYMRHAMHQHSRDGHSRHSTSAANSESTLRSEHTVRRSSAQDADDDGSRPSGATPRPGWPSTTTGGTVEPRPSGSSRVSETEPHATPDMSAPQGTVPPPPERQGPRASSPATPMAPPPPTPSSPPQPPPAPPAPPTRPRPPEPPPQQRRPPDRDNA